MENNNKYIVTFNKHYKESKFPTKKAGSTSTFELYASSFVYDSKIDGYVYSTGVNINIPMGCIGIIVPTESNVKTDCYYPNSSNILYPNSNKIAIITFKDRDSNKGINPPYKINDIIGELIIVGVPIVDFINLYTSNADLLLTGKDLKNLIKKKK